MTCYVNNIVFIYVLFGCSLFTCTCDTYSGDGMTFESDVDLNNKITESDVDLFNKITESDVDLNNKITESDVDLFNKMPESDVDKEIAESDNLYDSVYKKCCPPQQGLSRKRTNHSSVIYECIDAINENENIVFNTTLKYPLAPLTVIKPRTKLIIGFPNDCDVYEYIETQVASVNSIADDSCMDRIFADSDTPGDGSVVLLSCKNMNRVGLFDSPKFRSISKCCVGDMVFDVGSNICVRPNSSESFGFFSNLMELLPKDFDILDLKYGLPSCESPSVMMRYTSKQYLFKFHGNNLELRKGSRQVLFLEGTFCIDETREGDLVVRSCKKECAGGLCITKCCPEGQVYKYPDGRCGTKAVCGLSSEWGFSPKYYDVSNLSNPSLVEIPEVLGIRYKDSCPAGKYILNPSNPKDRSYLDVESGTLVLPKVTTPFGHDFCMEIVDSPCPNRPAILYSFVCFPIPKEKVDSVKMKVFSVGLVISSAFLAATFLVYLFLPARQNLHGRILMCYVVAMLVAYCCLARVQWPIVPESFHCKFLGYAIYFSFMSAFSWLNIMCFDIWLTFGNTRSIQMVKKNPKELKKLFLFSIYAFGFPLTLTTTVYLLDEYNVMDGVLDPNIGLSQCWFNTGIHRKPFLILFVLPAGLQIAANIVLFILTTIHCNKVKSEIHRMQAGSMGDRCKRRFMADKEIFIMNMKLFMVMGVTWIMEIVSACHNDLEELWFLPDVINVLQGVAIFVILVLKRKVYRLLRKRLGLDSGIRNRNDTSGVTSSTGISRTSCSEAMAKKQLSIDSSTMTMMNGKHK